MTVPFLHTYENLDRPLTIEEVDANWAQIIAAFNDLLGVAYVNDLGDGRAEFVAADGTVLGTLAAPPPFAVAGEWAAEAAYTQRSVVTWEGGSYLCAVAHVASESFPNDFTAGRWLLLAQSGEDGQDGQPGADGEDGADGSNVLALNFHNGSRTLELVLDTDVLAVTIPAGSGGSGPADAANVAYDATDSGLAAGDLQTAVDELAERDADLAIDGSELTLTTPRGRTVTVTVPSGGGGTPGGGDTVESFERVGDDLVLTTDQQAFTVTLPSGGGGGPVAAEDVSFETFETGDHAIVATDVRGALEELADREAEGRKAENISTQYVDVTVEDALDDHNSRLAAIGGTLETLDQRVTDEVSVLQSQLQSALDQISDLASRVATLESAAA